MNDKLDTLQNALRDLFVALGCNIDNVRDEQDVNDLIRALGTLQLGGGGGSELPEVTAEDNGDVLTVVSGEWAKAAPSGGGVLIVTDTDGMLDKTWQEINDAGFAVIKNGSGYTMPVIETTHGGVAYELGAFDGSEEVFYSTDSADGYPAAEG